MDDEGSTATMTSVTEELSLDESDITSSEYESSSHVTSSVAVEDGNDTAIHTQLQPVSAEEIDADNTHLDMDKHKKQSTNTTAREHSTKSKEDQIPPLPTDCNSKEHSGRRIEYPDFLSASNKWYEHHCFSHYWRHYHFVAMWCQKHMEVYRAVFQQCSRLARQQQAAKASQEISIQPGVVTFKKPTSNRTIRNRKARRRRKAAKKRMRMALKNAELAGSSCSSVVQSSDETQTGEATAEEQMQLEISEEMLDFFAHTHKHRQERDTLKKIRQNQEKKEKHVNIEEVDNDQRVHTSAPPTERPGARRTAEMRLLYGKGAAMIHGMETALQMTFDRNLDVRQPSLWPNMPFRVTFD